VVAILQGRTQLTQLAEGQSVELASKPSRTDFVHGHVDSPPRTRKRQGIRIAAGRTTPPANFTKVVQRIPVRIALDTTRQTRASNGGGNVGDPDD